MWRYVELTGGRVQIPDARITIYGAYHPIYDSLMGLPGMKCVFWTSSGGEMGFAPVEIEYLNRILRDPRVDRVIFGSKVLSDLFPRSCWAPYPLCTEGYEHSRQGEESPSKDNSSPYMTLFCPEGPKKNITNQLMAAVLIQRENGLILRTNIPVPPLFLSSGLKCVCYGWLPRQEYDNILSRSSLNLAVSWAETFHYQSAEAALMHVPSVGSQTIPWLQDRFKVRDSNNPEEIATVGIATMGSGLEQYENIKSYAISVNDILADTIKNLLVIAKTIRS